MAKYAMSALREYEKLRRSRKPARETESICERATQIFPIFKKSSQEVSGNVVHDVQGLQRKSQKEMVSYQSLQDRCSQSKDIDKNSKKEEVVKKSRYCGIPKDKANCA